MIERKLEYQVSDEAFGILGERGLYESFEWPSKDKVIDVLARLLAAEKEISERRRQLSELGIRCEQVG